MASITPRGGRYLVRVRRKGYPTITKTFTLKSEANAWAKRVEVEIEAGRWAATPPATVPTLRGAITEYEATAGKRLKGAADYAYRFRQMMSEPMTAKLVTDVTAFDVAAWRDKETARCKASTVVRKLALLSAVFSWCLRERGWITSNPVQHVAKPRVSDSRARLLSEDEWRYLLDAASTSKAQWLPDALTVLMFSAMRRGELFGLTCHDLDHDSKIARLHDTKAGCAREVPLCPEAFGALKRLSEGAVISGGLRLLPIGSVGSLSVRFAGTVRRALAAYEADCTQRGIGPDPRFLRDVRLHDLRHHAVTHWASTGALSVFELMTVSGHKTPRMLTRYTHLSPAKLSEKLAALAGSAASPSSSTQSIGA
jgi:integrase